MDSVKCVKDFVEEVLQVWGASAVHVKIVAIFCNYDFRQYVSQFGVRIED